MSLKFGGKKEKSKSEEFQQAGIDPLARRALTGVIEGAEQLRDDGASIVAPFDAATLQGLQQLQDRPQSAFIGTGADAINRVGGGEFLNPETRRASLGQISDTASGRFFGQNPATSGFNQGLNAIEDRVLRSARRAVGDQFTAAGRTGSPAEVGALGRAVTEGLSPFAFQAFGDQQQRQFGAFENERQRQLGAAQVGLSDFQSGLGQQANFLSLAPQFEGLQDAQSNRLLNVGQAIQQQNQNILDEPFQQFERFANPLIAAAGGLPVSLTTRGRSSGSAFGGGFEANLI